MTPTIWHGCYDEGWKGLVVDQAWSHPAKFSRGLIRRIYSHCLERGYISPGDTILDPFAGVGLGALDAMANGLNYTGCELEPRFCDIAAGCDCTGISKADWIRFYGRWSKVNHRDGRHWCPECIEETSKVTVDNGQLSLFDLADSGASYVRNSGRIPFTRPHRYNGNLTRFKRYAKPGTWARLVRGDSRRLSEVIGGACGVVSSPPFQNQFASHDNFIPPHDTTRLMDTGRAGYGSSNGQLSNLPQGDIQAILTSPPFAGNSGGRGEASRNGIDAALFDRHSGGMTGGMGDDPANLGNLPVRGFDAVVGSPPYAGTDVNPGNVGNAIRRDTWGKGKTLAAHPGGYGSSSGQLGAMPEGNPAAIIGSPPFSPDRNQPAGRHQDVRSDYGKYATTPESTGYATPGQLGNLPQGDPAAVIASPPFAGSVGSDDPAKRGGILVSDPKRAGDRNLTGCYGNEPGQLGAMVEGVRFTNNLQGVWICQNAKSAKKKSLDGVDGVSPAPTDMLAKSSREEKNRTDLAPNSQKQSSMSLCPTTGERNTSTGAVAMVAGEDTHGEDNGGQLSIETDIGVPGADQVSSCKSITKDQKRKPVESGITNSTTSKPSALDATSNITGPNGTTPPAPSAENKPEQKPLSSIARLNVRESPAEGQQKSLTENATKPISALSAVENSSTLADDINIAHQSARTQFDQQNKESTDEEPETFWAAAKLIVSECYQVLKPGGHTVWVLKNFIKDGKEVQFSQQWRQLCEACGFEFVEEIRAMLVKDKGAQGKLDGGVQELKVERKSFFRRIYEQKFPDRTIDWETVLILRKPARND